MTKGRLELFDLDTDRRLRDTEIDSGLRKAASPRNYIEIIEMIEVEG
jgi:hypothetical protein